MDGGVVVTGMHGGVPFEEVVRYSGRLFGGICETSLLAGVGQGFGLKHST